jgi:hypothetical protein
VIVEDGARLPEGCPIRVEVRDTSLEDAPAPTVAEGRGAVGREPGPQLDTIELRIATLPRHTTVWVHVDVDGDGRVSPGDYVTTASYPVPAGDAARLDVKVRRV